MRGRASRPVNSARGCSVPPLSPVRCGARGAGPGAVAGGQSRAGPRSGEMLQLFFSAEEGGRWIELCHVADKFPLASSPCTSPPPLPSARTLEGFSFFPCFSPHPFLMFPVSPLDIFACLASWPRYAAAGGGGGGGERFSWLSTFPCLPRCAAHPAEAPPIASLPAALPWPPRGVWPGADALVLPAEEPASCREPLISVGKGGNTPTIQFGPLAPSFPCLLLQIRSGVVTHLRR